MILGPQSPAKRTPGEDVGPFRARQGVSEANLPSRSFEPSPGKTRVVTFTLLRITRGEQGGVGSRGGWEWVLGLVSAVSKSISP